MTRVMGQNRCQDGGYQPHEHRPTPETRGKVTGFICAGFLQDQIANYLGISVSTLHKYYRKELDEVLMDKTFVLSENLYTDALNGDKQAREFWLRSRAGWCPAKPKEDKENQDNMRALLEKIIDKI